jgi:hypothetical protein
LPFPPPQIMYSQYGAGMPLVRGPIVHSHSHGGYTHGHDGSRHHRRHRGASPPRYSRRHGSAVAPVHYPAAILAPPMVTPPLSERVKAALINVPDFPKPGIQFKDISGILANPPLYRELNSHLARTFVTGSVRGTVCRVARVRFFFFFSFFFIFFFFFFNIRTCPFSSFFFFFFSLFFFFFLSS